MNNYQTKFRCQHTGRSQINKQILIRSLLIVAAVFTIQLSFAQQNYSVGYVVTNEGDTLLGSIDYNYWRKPPEKISFRNSGGTEKFYTPGDIKAFSVENIVYVSASVEIEVSPKRAAVLPDTPELILKTDDIFLLTLISGSKSLFHYSSEMINDNFFIKQNGEYKLLKYKKYRKKEKNGSTVEGEIQTYIGQLVLYLNDCSDIQKILNDTRYTQKSLIKAFKDYYTCINATATGYKRPRKSELEFGPVIGGTTTSIKFKGIDPFLTKIEFTDSKNLAAGAFVEVILSKINRTWSVYNELLYTSHSFNEFFNEIENGPYYSKNDLILEYQYINLNSLLRYRFNFNGFNIFANGGFSLGLPFVERNERIIKTNYQSTEKVRTAKVVNMTRRRDLSGIAGIGAEYKKLGLQIRYEAGKGIARAETLKSPTSSFAMLLTYSF